MIGSRGKAGEEGVEPAMAVPLRGARGMDEIARRLDDLLKAMAEVPPPQPAVGAVEPDQIAAARRERAERRERQRVFGPAIFGDHGWDILLDLFIALEEGREVTVFTICREMAVPEAAVLRCIATLIGAQLVVRQPQESDPRRMLLALTEEGFAMLCDYFNRMAAMPGDAAA
jgi:hypothetical protein